MGVVRVQRLNARNKRCRFRVTGSCTDSGQIHVVARAVFLPLESNLTLLGVGYFQSTKTLQRVCF